ncbi:hypothetical protein V5799_004888 [Amblyomma americanum]|uniref:Uncharacterized protein n=1 Tax=Amblyomma americanum TaxID=6943 RepID=A0AAQ4D4T1_AMBAM
MYVRYSLFLDWKHYREVVDVAAARFPGWEDREPPEYAAELRCLRFLSRLMPEPFVYAHWNAHLRNLRHLEEALGAMTEHVVDETISRVRALNMTPRLTGLFRDAVFGLKNQLLVPEWMRTPSLRMKFSKFVFSDAEASPMVTWNGALRALRRNSLRKLVDRGFETFWHGPALGFDPWLNKDEGYLAVPPAAVKRIFTERAFSVHHLPRIGLDLARAVVGHFLQMAFHLKRK